MIAILATILYSGVLTAVIFKTVEKTIGIRVSEEEEFSGLDITQHNEIAYNQAD